MRRASANRKITFMAIKPNTPPATRSKVRQGGSGNDLTGDNADDSQVIAALARGLEVLGAFHLGDRQLGNHELATRTGLPKATVSRITFTLAKSGFLSFDQRQRMYHLGPKALNLGFVARADADIRGNLRPMMQQFANETGLNIGLGVRDKDSMLYIDTWEGTALVGLKVYPGFRIPFFTTAMGRAYLAALTPGELQIQLGELARQMVNDGLSKEDVDKQIDHYQQYGFSISLGDWVEDIGTIAVPFSRPDRRQIYVISVGGPIYRMTRSVIYDELGPRLIAFRNSIESSTIF